MCHCCNHFILMCSFYSAGPVQPRPGPARGCCCISAPDLHFTTIGPAIILDKPRVKSKLCPGWQLDAAHLQFHVTGDMRHLALVLADTVIFIQLDTRVVVTKHQAVTKPKVSILHINNQVKQNGLSNSDISRNISY